MTMTKDEFWARTDAGDWRTIRIKVPYSATHRDLFCCVIQAARGVHDKYFVVDCDGMFGHEYMTIPYEYIEAVV